MRKVATEEFDLTQEGVHRASEKIEELLADAMIGSSESLQLKLISEETLLKYKDRFGEDAEVTILFSEFFGNVKLTLCIKCGSYDPFAAEEAPMSGLMRSMLINTKSVDEVWRYRDGINYIKFSVARARKTGQLSRILIGILCGLAGGLLINAVLPGHASMIAEKIMIPLTNSFAGLFCVMATLMCFCAICLGIVRMGDITTFSAAGRKIIWSF